jgi:Tfp pilus assembly protein PilV
MSAPSFRAIGGFTLAETVVAAALLATAVAALAHLVTLAAQQSQASLRQLTATVAAQSKLEELRAAPWTALFAGDDEDDLDAPFIRRWTTSTFDPTDPDSLVLQACVFDRARTDQQPEACVVTIRTRRP